ncbi:MAG: argininosuccinate lyase [Endomicrobiia bacterium]
MEKNLLKEFLSSFKFDFKLAKYDILSCIAWTELLIKNKIVDKTQGEKIIRILQNIKKNPKKILPSEDIHFAVEETLEKLLGKQKHLAGIIRTARSRNDLVVSDERMFLKEEIKEIIKLLKSLVSTIVKLAEKNFDISMVGYTHLQPAQPVLFSHYILSFAWWFVRDIERLKDCYKRVDVSVLGSAAFAGSSFEIDRKEIAKKLGFSKVSENSVDSVSDRDFVIEFISCCSIIMMHLSRISEELIIWCNPNFGYISLPKELTSGSSIMPQKQNPDYLELIRGKSAKVYSDLLGILVLMKSLPLSYNRDMQEDKVYLFSCVNTTK